MERAGGICPHIWNVQGDMPSHMERAGDMHSHMEHAGGYALRSICEGISPLHVPYVSAYHLHVPYVRAYPPATDTTLTDTHISCHYNPSQMSQTFCSTGGHFTTQLLTSGVYSLNNQFVHVQINVQIHDLATSIPSDCNH